MKSLFLIFLIPTHLRHLELSCLIIFPTTENSRTRAVVCLSCHTAQRTNTAVAHRMIELSEQIDKLSEHFITVYFNFKLFSNLYFNRPDNIHSLSMMGTFILARSLVNFLSSEQDTMKRPGMD